MSQKWMDYGSHLYPSVVINDFTFRGTLNPYNIFEAVCASFEHKPHACERWLKKEGIQQQPVESEEGLDSDTLILIVGVLVALNLVLIITYRYFLQKEMKEDRKIQVSSAVSQYVALSNF
mmetsp:Transcript_9305/g.15686  ORF Transcript_9305/g.15686 Transcript_9305/m.15686 type:complete len:120 (+) Transcript_9305:1069-1428(+)